MRTVPGVVRPPTRSADDGSYLDDSVADDEIRRYLARSMSDGRAYEQMPALSAWMRQMEQFPQLSAEAQGELVADYQRGLAAKERLKTKLSTKERRIAVAQVRRGDYALTYIVGSQFRILYRIAREKAEERFGKARASELIPDLVSEGRAELIGAAARFDPTRGPGFPAYAARVIRDRVRTVLARDTQMAPAHSWVRLKRIASVRRPRLATTLGREPTVEEIQEDLLEYCMKWAEKRLTDGQRALPEAQRRELQMEKLVKQGMIGAIRNYDQMMLSTQQVGSLDATLSDDGGATVGDRVANADDGSAFDEVELADLKMAMAKALAELPERDREILMYRFGFIDDKRWTYQELAPRYGVSAERIRQIEHKAVAKLRIPGDDGTNSLGAFLDR